jgi:hypothetical protein
MLIAASDLSMPGSVNQTFAAGCNYHEFGRLNVLVDKSRVHKPSRIRRLPRFANFARIGHRVTKTNQLIPGVRLKTTDFARTMTRTGISTRLLSLITRFLPTRS